ncbi:hypothetical protein EDD75_1803 [Thermodesulfitimonas autotrophica]|uniref:Uncharacterized protein n=1 Tax=Thermodesulfitimonas autotrophica TaxID=1894989 RepID=A0A3N5BAH5_9THEO|nr:hypothetical protein [Thermodesulfitimonas autotrophica]RPF42695.1 hypothetical protein EDD75_1803 [Thermodesulfitimonas autotrophica]
MGFSYDALLLPFLLLLGAVLFAFYLAPLYRRGGKRFPGGPAADAGNRNVSEDARCLRCNAKLELLGTEKFRCGGTSGGWKLIFGEWAELGEQMMPLEVWVCPRCRKVEFRVPAEN